MKVRFILFVMLFFWEGRQVMRIQKKAFLKNFLVSIKNFHLLSVLKKIMKKWALFLLSYL